MPREKRSELIVRDAPPNKEMQLTRPPQVATSQLISTVMPTPA
jgi:hypothetical protein